MPPEIYVSTDVESDGPIPGPNSMLSFGSVALDAEGTLHGEYSANLLELRGAVGEAPHRDRGAPSPLASASICRAMRVRVALSTESSVSRSRN